MFEFGQAAEALTAVRPAGLSVQQLQDAVAYLAPLVDRLNGWVDRAVGELAARGPVPAADGREVPVQAWLRDATTCGGSAAGSRVRTATLLRELPAVADAVLDGRVGQAQAAVLTRLVGHIPAAQLLDAQDALVQVAAGRDPQALAVWVRELIPTHCEPALDADERSAQAKRYLQLRNEHDGTVRGSFLLPTGDAETLYTVLEPLARPTGLGDSRSAGQRRADALVEVCEQVLRLGALPDAGGHRPQVSYVLPSGWAAAQEPPQCGQVLAAELGGRAPKARQVCATASWTGPQTRPRLEAILYDARISRVLTDRSGQVRGLEALSDSVTSAQRRALAVRDLGCVARGCTRPPAMTDAHHLVHREDGGATSLDNVVNREHVP